ncbi:MAG: tetratricopeptide repeat protein [Acidobacteriota bacterium]|nr:MAG: tetratricopeptide repeat protein [Acidobacteriota bacterium]
MKHSIHPPRGYGGRMFWWLLLAGLSLAVGCARGPRPNVLFITVDTLRADRLGCAGYPIETPAIDRLAEEGVYFPGLYVPAPVTLPSHASLFTSERPFSHGVRMNGVHVLGESHTTLAEVLESEGYETGAVIGAFVVHSMYGLGQGFSSYEEMENLPPDERGILAPRQASRTALEVSQRAQAWLQERESPWFLWVHYYDPHAPYEPPEGFLERYENAYDGEVAYTDRMLSRLLGMMREQDLLENTLVVFASDHGEALGEHGEAEHGLFLYQPTVRAPLILHGKNVPRGKRVEQAASLIDTAPTVLDLLGIEAPSEFQGQSLRPLWEQEGDALKSSYWEEGIYTETYMPYYNHRWAPIEGLIKEGWKYILAPKEELYNLAEDPKEERDLSSDEPEKAKAMRKMLIEERRRYPKAASRKADLSKEALEKLQSLGYLTGGRMTWEEPDALAMAETLTDSKSQSHFTEGIILQRAMALLNEGKIEESIQVFEKEAEKDPDNLVLLKHIAEIYEHSGETEKALPIRRRMADINPTEAFFYYRSLADWEDRQGNKDATQDALRKALDSVTVLEVIQGALFPEDYSNRALCYQLLGEEEEAEAELRSGLDRYPTSTLLHFALGALYHEGLGRLDDARARYEKVLELDPRSRDAKVNLANVLREMGEYERALALIKEVHVEFGPTAQAFYNIALIYLNMGKGDEGEQFLLQALETNPRHTLSLLALAESAFKKGDIERGTALCGRVLETEPANRTALIMLEAYGQGEAAPGT